MSANTICWTDIPVTDLDRAIAFYSAVLDSEVAKQSGPGLEFGLLPNEVGELCGCLVVTDNNAPSQTGPLIYLSVDERLDAAVKAVEDRGGKVLQQKHAIGPYGFRAVVLDSEGNRIALHSQTA